MFWLICLLFPGIAEAAGYYFSESGVVSTGRGGAIIASTRDQFSQWHNPAGLARIGHPTVSIGISAVMQSVWFRRLGDNGEFFEEVQNGAGVFPVLDMTVTGLNGIINEPVDETLELPAGFQDAWSIRLGGEYQVIDQLALRAGGFFERGAIEKASLSAAIWDPDKFQFGLGATGKFFDQSLSMDISFAYIWLTSLQIRDSASTQINVLGDNQAVVANGDYRANGWVIGGQASWAFKKRHEKAAGRAHPNRRAWGTEKRRLAAR